MHRQFITYQGKPLVVGEEDDLLTIPEPGIEVNEILGSEEVTEKIAEDVQVGDFVTKGVQTFEYDSMRALDSLVRFCNFFEDDGYLYAAVDDYSNAPAMVKFYRYDGTTWEAVGFNGHNSPFFGGFQRLTSNSFARTVSVESGIYNIRPYFNDRRKFAIHKKEGNVFRPIMPVLPVGGLNGTNPINSGDMIDFSGTTHLLLAGDFSDGYAYTLSGEYLASSTISGTIPGTHTVWTKMLIHEGDLYGILGRSGDFGILKWDQENSLWNVVVTSTNAAHPADAAGFHQFIELSDGNLYVTLGGNGGGGFQEYIQILRVDLDSSSVSQVYNLSSNAYPAGQCYRNRLFEDGSSLYIASELQAPYTYANLDASNGIWCAKYNTSTSAWDPIASPDITVDNIHNVATSSTDITVIELDVTSYNGETFLMVGTANGTYIEIYKFISSTETWEKQLNIQDLPGIISFYAGDRGGGFDIIEFSGTTYMVMCDAGNDRYRIYKYDVDGDTSSIKRLPNVDIGPSHYGESANLFENDNTLYMITGSRSVETIPHVYQFNTDTEQFQKLVDSSSVTPWSTNNVSQQLLAETSGNTTYIMEVGFWSPYWKFYEFSGGVLTQIGEPSILSGSTTLGRTGTSDFIKYEDELIGVWAGNSTQVSSDSLVSFKKTSTGWDTVPINYDTFPMPQGDRGGLAAKMWKSSDGNLYCYTSFPRSVVGYNYGIMQYDSSAGEWNFLNRTTYNANNYTLTEGISIHEYNGSTWIFGKYDINGLTGGVYELKPDGTTTFHTIMFGGAFASNAGRNFAWMDRGDLKVVIGTAAGNRIFKFSEFFGEKMWKKSLVDVLENPVNEPEAYGIALESGSKGDTIRIQKVRR